MILSIQKVCLQPCSKLHTRTAASLFPHNSRNLLQNQRSKSIRCKAEGGNNGVSEEVLTRLRAAEAEAAELRKELAAAKAASQGEENGESAEGKKATFRIDGSDLRRESPFRNGSESGNWLNESDVDFFTRGPSETDSMEAKVSSEEKATVQRRLFIGLGLAAVAGGLALIPDSALQLAPSKPLFFYLVPLIRVQGLLKDAEPLISNAEWDDLRALLSRIQGSPNDAESSLRSAMAGLKDRKLAEKAQPVARDIIEFLTEVDYNKYFDSMGGPGSKGGEREASFSKFSLQAVKAAEVKLAEFLALMPSEDLEAANQQVAAFATMF